MSDHTHKTDVTQAENEELLGETCAARWRKWKDVGFFFVWPMNSEDKLLQMDEADGVTGAG